MVRSAVIFFAVCLAALIGGCTDIERSGYSPIPQNSPGSWSYRPYGDMQN